MDGGDRQQRWDCYMSLIYTPIRKNQDGRPVLINPVHLDEKTLQCYLQRHMFHTGDHYLRRVQPRLSHALDFQKIRI